MTITLTKKKKTKEKNRKTRVIFFKQRQRFYWLLGNILLPITASYPTGQIVYKTANKEHEGLGLGKD